MCIALALDCLLSKLCNGSAWINKRPQIGRPFPDTFQVTFQRNFSENTFSFWEIPRKLGMQWIRKLSLIPNTDQSSGSHPLCLVTAYWEPLQHSFAQLLLSRFTDNISMSQQKKAAKTIVLLACKVSAKHRQMPVSAHWKLPWFCWGKNREHDFFLFDN